MKTKDNTTSGLRKRIVELENIIQRTEILFSIAEAGINSTNLLELLNHIVKDIAYGTSANRVAMLTIDQNERKIDHFVRSGPGADQIDLSISYPELMHGLSGWAIQNKKSALSPKDKPDPRESAAVRKRRKETNCGSIIVTPLQHAGQILGTITAINNPTDRNFTERDVVLISAAASQAASAIVKASLYQELEHTNQLLNEHSLKLERDVIERKKAELEILDHAAQLTTLNQLSKNIVSSFDLDKIYGFAHEAVEKLMPLDAFHISLVLKQDKVIEDAYLFDSGKRYPNERASLLDPSITTLVVNSRQSLFIKDDAQGQSKEIGAKIYGTAKDTRSVLIVPLIERDEVIGVVSAQHYRPNMYTPTHVQLLELLANQLSTAIVNARLHAALQQEAIRDPLTGLFNRRFMEEALEKELQRSKRNRRTTAIGLLDLDDFKHVNDNFGHDAGDNALRMLSKLLEEKIRGGDIACRYGGEEFALILAGATLNQAYQRMNDLRQAVEETQFSYQEKTDIRLTCSIGIAVFPEHGKRSESLFLAADKALYRAKRNGRNQVIRAE